MGVIHGAGARIRVTALPSGAITLYPCGRTQGESVVLTGFDWCTEVEVAGCYSVLALGYL